MMARAINIINSGMELSEISEKWQFNEKYRVWALEDVLYTPKPLQPEYQCLSIYVPENYMKANGVIDESGECCGYTAKTAPVIFNNTSAGYMMMTHMRIEEERCFGPQYLARGHVYVTVGNRGHQSEDENGRPVGKLPANLIDLKMALRFLRHNRNVLPGDFDKIISVGWSAGGAMSTLVSVTGDSPLYDEYLEADGAFMEESDSVYAGQIYCPITDLEHADMAYEWMFAADKENEASHAGPAGKMDAFREALSQKLYRKYIGYFNSLALKDPDTGAAVTLSEDGRGGTAYELLMKCIRDSADKFVQKLNAGELYYQCPVGDYIKGNYIRQVRVFGPEGPHYTEAPGDDKSSWLAEKDGRLVIPELDDLVLCYRRRMKPCPAFDVLSMDSGENRAFGTVNEKMLHFSTVAAEALYDLKDEFPEEYEKYYSAYKRVEDDEELQHRRYIVNPMNFIGTDEKTKPAEHYRIRVGTRDADTSYMVGLTLYLKLKNAGYDASYELVWDEPHTEADYKEELYDWIDSICR